MRKKVFSIFAILLVINFVSAAILIDDLEKTEYKIGEKIDLAVTISSNEDGILFLSATLECPSGDLEFFKTPLDLVNDNYIDIPELTINEDYVGSCNVKFRVLDVDDNSLEKAETEEIEIKNEIDLEFSLDKESYNPGESIIIKGSSEKGAELRILLEEGSLVIDEINKTLASDIFSITMKLDDEISSGYKELFVFSEDEFGNKAKETIDVYVNQIPRLLSLEIEGSEISHDEFTSFEASIFDQSNVRIVSNITYRVFDPNSNLIESLTSSEKVILNFSYPVPGEYIIKASYKELEETSKFNVLENREIDFDISEGVISVENKGNVRYIEDMIVNASIADRIYQVPISLNLGINERALIDLRNELPQENYNIAISGDTENYNLENIDVQDNRPVVKKLSQGIARVTGSAIIETDKVSNVFYLGFFLVFVGFLLVFFVNRRFSKKITKVVDQEVVAKGKENKGLKESLNKNKKEKGVIKKMFGSYVDHNLLRKDFSSDIVKKEISILFTDIRGFSKIFDNKDSKDVAEMLNLYFSKSSQIVKGNNGFINKFIGDSVMALFNATRDDKNHLLNSIKSAIELNKEMKKVNEKLKLKNLGPIEVGIGIDSGSCAVGTVGSKDKLEFTAVGTPVNIAFRLQSMSDGSILITDRVYRKLKDKIKVENFGEFEMKNITGKVKVHKVLAIK